jgi:hypothetical protein
MSKFKAFFKDSVEKPKDASLPLDRFPEPIVLRALTSGESDVINDRCFKNRPGKGGKQERVFDVVKYNREISIASMVHPDLNDKELQESYGVLGADNLYSKMFLLGEANQILETVTDISGLGKTMDEEIEEAKN